MEEDIMPKKNLHSRTGTDETKRKTQERMERRSRKRSSSARIEKMERVDDRWGKMERYFSTGQSPQQAVAPTEEEEATAPNVPRPPDYREFTITLRHTTLGTTPLDE
jgi:hypothetical protein